MKRIGNIFLIILVSALTVLGISLLINRNDQSVSSTDLSSIPQVLPASLSSAPAIVGPDFIEAADKTVHAVVHIKTELQHPNETYNNFFDLFNDFFGNPYQGYGGRTVIATGSGVILSEDGYIVTNNHVVQNAQHLEVTLNDKRTYDASIIGTDPSTDLALIKVNADDLPFLSLGNSDNVRVGEWVLAVGNPFNLTSTVTAGIVSAKARDINILGSQSAIESFIQTDAVVNRGNSGGALVNTQGDLVGINAAIASNTGSYTGYSFAIPANIVKKVIEDLKDYGEVKRAYLGIQFTELNSEFSKHRGLDIVNGISVEGVVENSAADKAGIKPGDIIVQIDDKPIVSSSTLMETIGTKRPGDEVNVAVVRDKDNKTFNLVLQDADGNNGLIKRNNIELLGASFESVSPEELNSLNIQNGVKVKGIKQGKLYEAGVREGFIITEVDRLPVQSVNELSEILQKKRGGTLIEGIYPNGQRVYYGLGL